MALTYLKGHMSTGSLEEPAPNCFVAELLAPRDVTSVKSETWFFTTGELRFLLFSQLSRFG
jgi:hypothetical protein